MGASRALKWCGLRPRVHSLPQTRARSRIGRLCCGDPHAAEVLPGCGARLLSPRSHRDDPLSVARPPATFAWPPRSAPASTGVLYVAPMNQSIGLHSANNDRLLATLFKLRDLGNTLKSQWSSTTRTTIRAALDASGRTNRPGAGVHGGHIGAEGSLQNLLEAEDSNHRCLSQAVAARSPTPPERRKRPGNARKLSLVQWPRQQPSGPSISTFPPRRPGLHHRRPSGQRKSTLVE